MRRRSLIVLTVILFLAGWGGAAVYRVHDVRTRAYQTIMSYPPAERAKMIAPGSDGPDVRVPLLPLLLNPFKAKPHAYLYSGDFVMGEVNY